MTMQDPIADLLTKIRNAGMASHKYLDIRFSKVKLNIIKILKNKGFITDYEIDEGEHFLRVYLKYDTKRKSVIRGLTRASSPGCREYVKCDSIPHVFKGTGLAIVSTSKGILEGEEARKMGLGGELICRVW